MAVWRCLKCSTAYAVGAPECPHCGGKGHVENDDPAPTNKKPKKPV